MILPAVLTSLSWATLSVLEKLVCPSSTEVNVRVCDTGWALTPGTRAVADVLAPAAVARTAADVPAAAAVARAVIEMRVRSFMTMSSDLRRWPGRPAGSAVNRPGRPGRCRR